MTAPALPAQTAGASPGPGPDPRRLLRLWATGWGAVVQLVLDVVLAAPYLALTVLLVVGAGLVPVFGVGLVIVAVVLVAAQGIAGFERARLRAFTGRYQPPPLPPRADQPAWRRLLLDSRPWKAGGHLAVMTAWGLTGGLALLVLVGTAVALTLAPLYAGALPDGRIDLLVVTAPGGWWWGLAGLLGLVIVPFVALALVQVDLAVGRALLGPTRAQREELLRERVDTLTRTRVGTVDSVEAERRRIERDLHDGPQQRLVAIAMDLGLARQRLAQDPARAQELLDHAHTAAKEAITEMRQVARGIHPPVLTDRGLDAALSALAAASPVPVAVTVDLPHRPGPTLESIAYFCVSEALTNVAKHAQAHRVTVDVRHRDGALVATVTDDGVGGAQLGHGTGLVGLRQRAAAVDGTVEIASPPGGPTVVTVRLPDPAGRIPS